MMKRVCALTMETTKLFQDFTASGSLNNNDLTCNCLFFFFCVCMRVNSVRLFTRMQLASLYFAQKARQRNYGTRAGRTQMQMSVPSSERR